MNVGGNLIHINNPDGMVSIPLSRFSSPWIPSLDDTLPITFSEVDGGFRLTAGKGDTLLNGASLTGESVLEEGDIIEIHGARFRFAIVEYDAALAFDTFWYSNLYLDNLPVFSPLAFRKIIDVEIKKAHRYSYQFALILFRFNPLSKEEGRHVERVICENIRFNDMLCGLSRREYIVYVHQASEEQVQIVGHKLHGVLDSIIGKKPETVHFKAFMKDFENFDEMLANIYSSPPAHFSR